MMEKDTPDPTSPEERPKNLPLAPSSMEEVIERLMEYPETNDLPMTFYSKLTRNFKTLFGLFESRFADIREKSGEELRESKKTRADLVRQVQSFSDTLESQMAVWQAKISQTERESGNALQQVAALEDRIDPLNRAKEVLEDQKRDFREYLKRNEAVLEERQRKSKEAETTAYERIEDLKAKLTKEVDLATAILEEQKRHFEDHLQIRDPEFDIKYQKHRDREKKKQEQIAAVEDRLKWLEEERIRQAKLTDGLRDAFLAYRQELDHTLAQTKTENEIARKDIAALRTDALEGMAKIDREHTNRAKLAKAASEDTSLETQEKIGKLKAELEDRFATLQGAVKKINALSDYQQDTERALRESGRLIEELQQGLSAGKKEREELLDGNRWLAQNLRRQEAQSQEKAQHASGAVDGALTRIVALEKEMIRLEKTSQANDPAPLQRELDALREKLKGPAQPDPRLDTVVRTLGEMAASLKQPTPIQLPPSPRLGASPFILSLLLVLMLLLGLGGGFGAHYFMTARRESKTALAAAAAARAAERKKTAQAEAEAKKAEAHRRAVAEQAAREKNAAQQREAVRKERAKREAEKRKAARQARIRAAAAKRKEAEENAARNKARWEKIHESAPKKDKPMAEKMAVENAAEWERIKKEAAAAETTAAKPTADENAATWEEIRRQAADPNITAPEPRERVTAPGVLPGMSE